MAQCRFVRDEAYWNAEVLVLENSGLRVKVVPEKGSDIVEILYKKRNLDLLYKSPIGFRRFGTISPPLATSDSGFMDYYEGGWQDILPNPGLQSSHRGASWGLHGESALLPWRAEIRRKKGTAGAHLWTELIRTPIRISKEIKLEGDEPKLHISWEVTNLGGQDIEFAWVQHIVFGRPMVGPGLRFDAKAGACSAGAYKWTRLKAGAPFEWPHAPTLGGGTVDMSREPPAGERFEDNIYMEMKEPWYAIRNTKLDLTVGVSWSDNAWRSMWYWLNHGALDYPWYGRSWNLGLEPSSSLTEYGMQEYMQKNNALSLKEGQTMRSRMCYSVKEGSEEVKRVDEDGEFTCVSS